MVLWKGVAAVQRLTAATINMRSSSRKKTVEDKQELEHIRLEPHFQASVRRSGEVFVISC